MDTEKSGTQPEATSLRTEILPTSFEKINQMDKDKKAEQIKLWTADIMTALKKHDQEFVERAEKDNYRIKNVNRVIGFTAKVLTEVSELLDLDSRPQFDFFTDENDSNWYIFKPGVDRIVTAAHAVDDNKVGMNINTFINLVEHVRSSPHAEITSVPQTVASVMSEELGHIYIALNHPKINEATVMANHQSRVTKDQSYYDNDAGENALHQFANEYADYVAQTQRWPFE